MLKLNPAGLVLAGITALVTYISTKLIPNTDAATEAQRKYNEELQRTQEELEKYKSIEDRYKNIDALNGRQRQQLKSDAESELAIIEDKLSKEVIAYRKYYDEQKKIIEARTDVDESQRKALLHSLDNQAAEKAESLLELDKRQKALKQIINSIPEEKSSNVTTTITTNQKTVKTTKENPQVTAENKRYYDELSDLKKSYLASDEMTQQEYTRFLEDLEMRHLENMLAIAGLEPDKRQQLEQKVLEMRIKYKEECNKLDEEEENKASEESFTRLEKQYQLEIQEATKKHYDTLSSEEDYYTELADIQQRYYDEVLNSTQISEEKKAEIQQRIEKQNLDKSEKNYRDHQQKIRTTLQMAQEIGKDFGTTFAELVTDSESTLVDYMKATINLILDTLQKIMLASVAETQIKAIASGGPFSWAGLAAAAGKIALITAAFETAKALISNFYTGGYTGDGQWDEPRGIVHAGEFVANRYAVQNPVVRPVLDLIDQAQKNNTIGSLTAGDVAQVISPSINVKSSNPENIISPDNDPRMTYMLQYMLVAIKKLNKKLEEPIFTYTKATGKMGVNEAQKLVEKMNQNASRKYNKS